MLFQCKYRKELKSWPSVSAEEVRTLHLLVLFSFVKVMAATGNLIKPLIKALLDLTSSFVVSTLWTK